MTSTSWCAVEPWFDIKCPVTNGPNDRSPQNYQAVLDQFKDVLLKAKRWAAHFEETNGRKNLITYCNIFQADVCGAMNAPPSHWINPETGDNVNPIFQGQPRVELTLRKDTPGDLIGWLRKWGPSRKWMKANPMEAMFNADQGRPTLVTYDAPVGGIGHVGVLGPGNLLYQAGLTNIFGGTVTQGFGNHPVEYWIRP